MSAGAPSPVHPIPPAESPAVAATAAERVPNVLHLLSIVRMLLFYGRNLCEKARRHPAGMELRCLAAPFGTTDIRLIITRILNGLHRAMALEQLLRERAVQEWDIVPAPRRERSSGGSGARDSAPDRRQPAGPAGDPQAVRLLSAEEILAEVRNRPIGVVIAEICREFGITAPDFSREAWKALEDAIVDYGGNPMALFPAGAQRYLAEGLIYADGGPPMHLPFVPGKSPDVHTLPPLIPP